MEPRPRFVIEAAEAEFMAKQSGQTVLQLLPSLVKPAQRLARPPISQFNVGAVGHGSSGRIFFGVNVEFPGLPLHHSIHAEQFLVTNLSLHSEPHLDSFAVSSAPCGHCRQFLQELRGAPAIKILITEPDGGCRSDFEPLLSLLPHRFGPDDLLSRDVPLLLEPHDNRLEFPIEAGGGLCNGGGENGFIEDELKRVALEAANASHAPYTKCPSGVAIRDCDGRVYRGSYAESAAYNPSLGPVQAALVAYIASGCEGGGYERIVAAVLVEKEGAMIRQEETARLLLRSISPRCEFRAFHCVSGCKKGCC
ncbi:Cytidine deaminase [Morus notabilis]|uniref:cytidine deaminase n=1 Tax=Morus notabilis TaxID=981085 RepID=W9QJW6_9ROSA|nr:cytidine deaminase 1 [Morus notabilis]EXB38831.1 Cytidine deaminase [Morus notabilis]